ncbi:MAG: thioredoxin domain-containing protein, partial [Desulfobacterales bacterium]|nr:thioredoxin domain-containing protein [Desulfobacterales bacterium]
MASGRCPVANRLAYEKSPYLLQHAHNPVNWHPWGEEAFAEARRADKPIFLSVGYATCHWCHVMERESFEDAEAAEALNDAFVCIKVDREERPDNDAVYMAVCQMVTGDGGWPLTVLMTADKKPFFAGTYLPKNSRLGRLGIMQLCQKINVLWSQEGQKVRESADALAESLADAFQFESDPSAQPAMAVVEKAVADISRRYDDQFAGFDGAPKFPMAHRLNLLLGFGARAKDEKAAHMATRTLEAMRLSGLWDHVGFGFHRYATDRQWLLPHFEKMLYDQALLALAYLEAFGVTRTPLFAQTAQEIFAYVLRDMTDP